MRRSLGFRAAALAAVIAIVGACTSGGQSTEGGAGASGTPGETAAASEAVPAGQFTNPVLNSDFPDPFVLKDGDTYYAYATGGNNKRIQAARSSDLVDWEQLGDAVPTIPSWSGGKTWAPEVAKTPAGYVMYYTLSGLDVLTPQGQTAQCISYGISKTAEGPFRDPNRKPWICQADLGGSIDPSPFVDSDGKRYLTWKNDGNCCGQPTRLWIQEMSQDGLKLVGQPKDMGVQNDAEWETLIYNLIEAPTLLLHEGTYYLFFSGAAFDTDHYAVGYATSRSVIGPYVDAPENPILKTREGSDAAGPGHQSIVQAPDGKLWVLYHAWDKTAVGYLNGGSRSLWLDELVFEGGKPVVKGPDDGPQPAPAP